MGYATRSSDALVKGDIPSGRYVYIEKLLELINVEIDPRLKRSLSRDLGDALAYDIAWALHFFSSSRPLPHRHSAVRALAYGLRQFTYVRPEDIQSICNDGGDWAGDLLVAVVGSKATFLPPPSFVRWLIDHRNSLVYERALIAVHQNPHRWNELVQSGSVTADMTEDYAAISDRHRRR